ncbi:MAG: hypothetical protein WAV29_02565 [Microgenomates group bacterium]
MRMESHQSIIAMSKPEAYRGDGDMSDSRYIPSRTLGGIRRQEGALFVLPDLLDVREYAVQLDTIREKLMVRGAFEPEPVYIPATDEILDVAIKQNILLLQERLTKDTSYVTSPYSHTSENEAWMEILRRGGYDVTADIALKSEDLYSLDNRGGWGRHVRNPDFIPVPLQAHIPYPESWISQDANETLQAYQNVVNVTGDPRVQMKGIFSAGGFVNKTVHSLEEAEEVYLEFLNGGKLGKTGAVEMQAFISDLDPKHTVFSMQYSTTKNGVHVIDTPGGIGSQIMDAKEEWIGNRFNDPALIAQYGAAAYSLFGELGKVLNGSVAKGGIDVSATHTTPSGLIVVEHNAKRMTGAHPAKELMEALRVPENMPAVSKKCEMNINCDLKTLWEVLEAEGESFDPVSKTGIFPLCWMNGHYGMLMAFGPVESTDILERQIDRVYSHLAQLGYVS